MRILKMASEMVESLNQKTDAYLQVQADKHGVSLDEYKKWLNKRYEIEMGRKYLKIWYSCNENKSIVMFIDESGDIFKPAGVNKVAAGIRGNIANWESCLNIQANSHLVFL